MSKEYEFPEPFIPQKRRKRGRPPSPGPKRQDVKLYLPVAAVERLREIGYGSASEGVMRLLAAHRTNGSKAA